MGDDVQATDVTDPGSIAGASPGPNGGLTPPPAVPAPASDGAKISSSDDDGKWQSKPGSNPEVTITFGRDGKTRTGSTVKKKESNGTTITWTFGPDGKLKKVVIDGPEHIGKPPTTKRHEHWTWTPDKPGEDDYSDPSRWKKSRINVHTNPDGSTTTVPEPESGSDGHAKAGGQDDAQPASSGPPAADPPMPPKIAPIVPLPPKPLAPTGPINGSIGGDLKLGQPVHYEVPSKCCKVTNNGPGQAKVTWLTHAGPKTALSDGTETNEQTVAAGSSVCTCGATQVTIEAIGASSNCTVSFVAEC